MLGDYVVCFATGTRILTERGAVAVEDLAVGDLAVTADGAHRPIRWIGHRTMDPRRHPEPNAVRPVRIAANALGEGKPARDLRVSPGHAIAIDVLGHVLVPAWALINGMTVTQEDVASVTYWHVELDGHDLLVAEGQPAESYLDMGNRGFFADSPVLDLAAGPDADAGARTHADFCRPYHDHGPLVDAVRARLHARALALGWHTAQPDAFADVRVEADGHPVHGDVRGMSARFVLPAGARDVWLSCPTAVPAAVLPDNGDGRALGLCLARITLDDGLAAPRAVALDDPLLCLGFHRIEADHRWTGGLVRLPAALFEGLSGAVFLRLDLHAPALPRWVGPAAQVAEAAAPRLAAVA